jgi:hypothetical protein
MQRLSCPGVRVINLVEHDEATLGFIRDSLVRAARHPLIMMWDDDDIYLPGHVSALVAKLRDGEPAMRLRRMLVWKDNTLSERGGSTNAGHVAIFRRSAYGGRVVYDVALDAGRDAQFWMNAARNGWYVGRHHHEPDGIYTTIVRMESDRRRASEVEIGITKASDLRRMWRDRIHQGVEPAGDVAINPQWSRNWSALVDEFLAGGKVAFT